MTVFRSDVLAPEIVLKDPEWIGIRHVLVVLDSREVVKHELVTDPRHEGEAGREDQQSGVQ